MLGQDGGRIAAARDAIGPSLDYVTRGDGFYRDGSFIQHGFFAYSGNYGLVALVNMAQLTYLLSGSQWPLVDPRSAHVFAFARESFVPLLIDGAMPDAFRGRKLAESGHTDRSIGRRVIGALAMLAEQAPLAEAAALRRSIKGWLLKDRDMGSALPLYEWRLLEAIAADPAIEPAYDTPGARIFPAMDRAILRGDGFAAVVSLTSPRTGSYEMGNGENLRGWWTGMGRLALYDEDAGQFGGDYWPTVDILRLPGTTTDRSMGVTPVPWKQYPNPEPWVGGVALGRLAALGMAYSMREVTGSPLRGRKSWFLVGNRIVALGSGIEAGQGPTETIVENRRLADPVGAALLVDGASLPDGERPTARWAHLKDDRSGSSIGYLFPQGASLVTSRSQREGSWRALNEYGSPQRLQQSYQVLAIAHGQPQYAYVLMPGASIEDTRRASEAPDLVIEANDDQSAAVRLETRPVYAANLWKAGSAPRGGLPYVTSSAPVAVVVEGSAGRLQVAIAEPTQNEERLELTLKESVTLAGSELDPGITILATSPHLRLAVDTRLAAGRTFHARFQLAPSGRP